MNDTDNLFLRITGQEFHTVLAALRYYQSMGLGDPAYRPLEIHAIASNDCNLLSSLDNEGIDVLCMALNLGERTEDVIVVDPAMQGDNIAGVDYDWETGT